MRLLVLTLLVGSGFLAAELLSIVSAIGCAEKVYGALVFLGGHGGDSDATIFNRMFLLCYLISLHIIIDLTFLLRCHHIVVISLVFLLIEVRVELREGRRLFAMSC